MDAVDDAGANKHIARNNHICEGVEHAAIAVVGLLPRQAGGVLRARPGGCLVEDAVLFHNVFAELRDAASVLAAVGWSMLSHSSFSLFKLL